MIACTLGRLARRGAGAAFTVPSDAVGAGGRPADRKPIMSTKSAIIIFLLAAGPLVALSVPFFPWIPDDAYISFQYARSFAEGDGLVFNPEERVEGFSNFLWTLGLALVPKTGGEIEKAAPVASYAAAFLSLALFVFFILRSPTRARSSAGRRSPTFVVGAIAIAFGSFFPLAFYATLGSGDGSVSLLSSRRRRLSPVGRPQGDRVPLITCLSSLSSLFSAPL